MDQVPDVMLSQDIVTAESAEFVNIRAINPVTVTDSTRSVSLITESDGESIEMSPCKSSQSSANPNF